MEPNLRKAILDIEEFKIDLKFMKASWSDNFYAQINETHINVMNLTKECEMILKMSDSIVQRGELMEIHKKLEKTAELQMVE